MSATVRELNQYFIDVWWESDIGLPDLGPLYTAHAQTQNEKGLLQFLDQVDRALSNPPRSRREAQALQARLGAAFQVSCRGNPGLQRQRNWTFSLHRLFRMYPKNLCAWPAPLIPG